MKCPFPSCEYETGEATESFAVALLNAHALSHQTLHANPNAMSSGPKLERPTIDIGASTENWNIFTRWWNLYRTGSGFNDTSAPTQLFQCASTELGDMILKSYPTFTELSIDAALSSIKTLAVIPLSIGALRADLMRLEKSRDEPFRGFTTRVRGKAETCAYKITCSCSLSVDFTDSILYGMYSLRALLTLTYDARC